MTGQTMIHRSSDYLEHRKKQEAEIKRTKKKTFEERKAELKVRLKAK